MVLRTYLAKTHPAMKPSITSVFHARQHQARLQTARQKYLGREFVYGNFIALVIAVQYESSRFGEYIGLTYLPHRWRSPKFYRWRKLFPPKKNFHTGYVRPAFLSTPRFGDSTQVLPTRKVYHSNEYQFKTLQEIPPNPHANPLLADPSSPLTLRPLATFAPLR
jgi:hypothetical protein